MITKRILKTIAILCVVQLQTTRWWEFPLQEISLPQCKIYTWAQMPDECKAQLPILRPSSYNLQRLQTAARLTYSMLRWASYNDGWNTAAWWHPGIDLPTAQGTPVYAIEDGVVIKAEYTQWYGNNITIEHRDGDKKIYSSYSHLDSIHIQKWASVQEWQLIGTVGKSWTSIWPFGNHLDFQIITSDKIQWPYGYADCPEWYERAVNQWICRDKLKATQVDPLAFFEQKNVSNDTTFSQLQQKIATTITPAPLRTTTRIPVVSSSRGIQGFFSTTLDEELNKKVENESGTNENNIIDNTENNTQESSPLLSKPLLEQTPEIESTKTESKELEHAAAPKEQVVWVIAATTNNENRTTTYDGKYRFRLQVSTPHIDRWDTSTIELLIQDKNGNNVQGLLTSPLQAKVNNNSIDVFPSAISFVQDGKKVLRITGENAGKATVSILYDLQEIATASLTVSN